MSEREPVAGHEPPEAVPTGPVEPRGAESDAITESSGSPGFSASSGAGAASEPDVEIVDGFPVLAEVRAVERVSPASLPAVQAAAAAGAGFVAGAATVALVRRRAARKTARNGRGGPRRAVDMLPIVGSRSFLVDVHVIGKQGD
jgi:hypothetical protein